MIDLGRKAIRSQWGLLGEWWCYPVDLNDDEKKVMLESIREGLGEDFAFCPLEYIEDRLFGGFSCADYDNRRHAYFATGCYSFLAAERGEFWALTRSDRWEQWETLLGENEAEYVLGDGPFTDDFPRREGA